jgi:hypothetical protein
LRGGLDYSQHCLFRKHHWPPKALSAVLIETE